MVDDDDNVKEQKRILKELRDDDAASTEVKGLIDSYSPTVLHDTNVNKLKRFSVKTLEQAAIFLGAKPTDSSGNKRYKSKASLNLLFLETCRLCLIYAPTRQRRDVCCCRKNMCGISVY